MFSALLPAVYPKTETGPISPPKYEFVIEQMHTENHNRIQNKSEIEVTLVIFTKWSVLLDISTNHQRSFNDG